MSVRLGLRWSALVLVVLLAPGCQKQNATQTSVAKGPSPLDEARTLIEQGQLDAALAKLQQSGTDPEGLYYQGVVWAKKAETAPLPTPPPAESQVPAGAEPPAAPEFKPEEITALGLFEKAIAAKPEYGPAHVAIAELLAPHAIRRYDADQAAQKKRPPKRGKGQPEPTLRPPTGPDHSPERIIRHYRQAGEGPAKEAALDAMIRFCTRVARLDDAAAAFAELVKNQEKAEPYVRFGDFLLNTKKDRDAALDQYKQALVWRAEDDATRAKIADIYIAMGSELYDNQQYAAAQTRFKEASRWVTDKSSPQGLKLRDQLAKIDAIRGR